MGLPPRFSGARRDSRARGGWRAARIVRRCAGARRARPRPWRGARARPGADLGYRSRAPDSRGPRAGPPAPARARAIAAIARLTEQTEFPLAGFAPIADDASPPAHRAWLPAPAVRVIELEAILHAAIRAPPAELDHEIESLPVGPVSEVARRHWRHGITGQ